MTKYDDKIHPKSLEILDVNSYVLNMVIEFYNAKTEPQFAYKHTIGKQEQYTYSQQFVDF